MNLKEYLIEATKKKAPKKETKKEGRASVRKVGGETNVKKQEKGIAKDVAGAETELFVKGLERQDDVNKATDSREVKSIVKQAKKNLEKVSKKIHDANKKFTKDDNTSKK